MKQSFAVQPQERPAPERLIIAAMCTLAVAALLLPVFSVRIVPTQDGPIHIALADIIARFGWYGPLQGLVGEVYSWNERLDPNLSVYVVMAFLIRLAGDPFIGHQLYLLLYASVFIATAFLAARQESRRGTTGLHPDGAWLFPLLALLLLPFSLFFHWGFFNYMLGVPSFLLFALWWRRPAHTGIGRVSVGAALALASACTHITAFFAVCLLLGAQGLNDALGVLRTAGISKGLKSLASDYVIALLVVLPGLVLVVNFLIGNETGGGSIDLGPWRGLKTLVLGIFLPSFSDVDAKLLLPAALAFSLVALLAFLKVLRGDSPFVDWTWPAFFIGIVVVSSLNLVSGQGVPLSQRLAIYGFIAAVFTAIPYLPGKRVGVALAGLLLIAIVGQSIHRITVYRSWAPVYEAAISAGRARPGATFAYTSVISRSDATNTLRVHVGYHMDQIAAVSANGASVTSKLPSVKYGYFPLRYQSRNDFFLTAPTWSPKYPVEPFRAYRAAHQGRPQILIAVGPIEKSQALASRLGLPSCYLKHEDGVGLVACEEEPPQTSLPGAAR